MSKVQKKEKLPYIMKIKYPNYSLDACIDSDTCIKKMLLNLIVN